MSLVIAARQLGKAVEYLFMPMQSWLRKYGLSISMLELGMEYCDDCGHGYITVYRLSDDLWAHISGGNRLLCIPCVERRAVEKGVCLYWEAAENWYPTHRGDQQ